MVQWCDTVCRLALKAAGNGGAAMGEHDMSTLCLQVGVLALSHCLFQLWIAS